MRLIAQLNSLPLKLTVSNDARAAWEQWYISLPSSEHSKRLDTIGFRLLALIALATDKTEIDLETVSTVLPILDYELEIRRLTDPIDADNTIARLEIDIRRRLEAEGTLTKRNLRREIHADRYGLWAFETALANLKKAGDIGEKAGKYWLV